MSLALRGRGPYPFGTADRTSGNAASLAAAGGWWGAATCPRAILVVAGDTFADALAAASLSDPTDRSEQPRLARVAAADPIFDPIGGLDRPDTAFAPVVVTTSARSGATGLAPAARTSAHDLARGGCTTAREAVIVGGEAAVPKGAERELLDIGYREVFRVAGADRFDTAAQVAMALGTGTPATTACLDADVTDGGTRLGFYGNAVAEFRPEPTSCRLLPRAVVLADGGTGADALAAGWWTSRWQVPILLTALDGSLPPATRDALGELAIDSLIVLGGTDRIPERTVEAATTLASASAGRIAGADRYATSVEMAMRFGGWFATGDPRDAAGDVLCVAASSGDGATLVGWPDALAAGPLCARLLGTGGPARALGPVEAPSAALASAGGSTPAHDAVPILLSPSGGALAPEVERFLAASFVPGAGWCSATAWSTTCPSPGFGVLLGGQSALPDAAAAQMTSLLSGAQVMLAPPVSERPFVTRLDLSPIFAGGTGTTQICSARGAVRGARWLAMYETASFARFSAERDLLRSGAYEGGVSLPTCTPTAGDAFAPVGADGVRGSVTAVDPDAPAAVRLSGPLRQVSVVRSTETGSSWTSTGPAGVVRLDGAGRSSLVSGATLDLQLRESGASAQVSGRASVSALGVAVAGTVSGEARRSNGVWEVRGQVACGALPDGSQLIGGFTATLVPGSSLAGAVSWQLDASPQVELP